MTQVLWVGPRIDGLHNMPVCTNPTCRDSPCGVQSASDSILDAPWGKVLKQCASHWPRGGGLPLRALTRPAAETARACMTADTPMKATPAGSAPPAVVPRMGAGPATRPQGAHPVSGLRRLSASLPRASTPRAALALMPRLRRAQRCSTSTPSSPPRGFREYRSCGSLGVLRWDRHGVWVRCTKAPSDPGTSPSGYEPLGSDSMGNRRRPVAAAPGNPPVPYRPARAATAPDIWESLRLRSRAETKIKGLTEER